ncbi:hypothetical protein ABW636_04165 [Aquimarina sp. 2201CG1-2-11]
MLVSPIGSTSMDRFNPSIDYFTATMTSFNASMALPEGSRLLI